MTPFATLTAKAVPFRKENIDTDQIIPARFLKYPREGGYDAFLFHDQRFDQSGAARPEFVLNDPEFKDARILVAGANFGNGSSREGAVYALCDYGIRCVIAPSFGPIFYKNCFSNGLLPAQLPEADIDALLGPSAGDGAMLSVDLPRRMISNHAGFEAYFEIEPFFQAMLMKGVDEIGLTLGLTDVIATFETAYFRRFPFLKRAG
jgi:3-isopropylmalate/(R)-2-methylmalate dehydratase small subunit